MAAGYNKSKSNHYLVNIYNSYSGELFLTLKGHTSVITDLQWDQHDKSLYTTGSDGNIFLFDSTRNWERKDFHRPDTKYHSLVFGERGVKLVCGEEKKKKVLREIEDKEFLFQDSTLNEVEGEKEEKEKEGKTKEHQLGLIGLKTISYLHSLKNY